MKKIAAILLVLTLIFTLNACSSAENKMTDEKNLSVVCTIFPEYDWVRAILGDKADKAELTMLIDSGVDLHSYQPTADDIIKISTCDVFIYVGGKSDEWVDGALQNATNKDMKVINLLDTLGSGAKAEEVKEGMETEEHEHEHEDEHEEGEEEIEYDEHVWLSLKNAAALCSVICEKLCEADSANAADYRANAESYIGELNTLDKDYADAVSSAKRNTLLFGDRFPFRYLADDYALDYYAAFVGCSAETEASFETIAFLAGKADELGLNSVITIEGTNHKIAETIVQNTNDKNQQILTMNSLQSVTSKEANDGASYLSVMRENLSVLKKALN